MSSSEGGETIGCRRWGKHAGRVCLCVALCSPIGTSNRNDGVVLFGVHERAIGGGGDNKKKEIIRSVSTIFCFSDHKFRLSFFSS